MRNACDWGYKSHHFISMLHDQDIFQVRLFDLWAQAPSLNKTMVARLQRLTFQAFCWNKLDFIFATSKNGAPTKFGPQRTPPHKSGTEKSRWKFPASSLFQLKIEEYLIFKIEYLIHTLKNKDLLQKKK